MKKRDHVARIQSLSLGDLRKEVLEVEKKIQAHKLALAFGKSKESRTIRNLRRELARTLTFANQKLSAVAATATSGEEK